MNKYALFDFDGCLIESRDSIRKSYLDTIEYGVKHNLLPNNIDIKYCKNLLEDNNVLAYIGGPGVYNLQRIINHKSPVEISTNTYIELMEYYNIRQYENYQKDVIYSGVLEGLQTLQNNGFKFIIVTARKDLGIKEAIKKHQHTFKGIKFLDTAGILHEKEEKEDTIKRVIQDHNINSNDIIFMIGDKNSDIYAGNKAGENLNYPIKTIFCRYGHEVKDDSSRTKLNQPSHYANNFTEVIEHILKG